MKQQLLIIALIGFFTTASHAAELPIGIIKLDSTVAKNFTVKNLDGEKYNIHSSKGKWVFLHFWASWCGPCRREMPVIEKLITLLKNKPIDIVLINTSEDEDTIFSFLGSMSPDLQSYMDKDGELTEEWAPRGLPTTFFIDPKGRKRYLALGGRDWLKPEYQKFLNELFSEK